MKIAWDWLQEFIDINTLELSLDELAKTLAMLGFPVEALEETGEGWVLDLEVTTNRPDCLSHLGIARELSAKFGLKLREPDLSLPSGTVPFESMKERVTIEVPDSCPRYAARIITGLEVGPSPEWLQRRLESIGQRPINNIVDVTNYLLHELGQPLHGFDLDQLRGRRVVIRFAEEGEQLTTLDGAKRVLDSSMLVIADASRAVALGGIIGGMETEISPVTKNMLLESAYFDPSSIRRTSKRLGLRTDASYRFERGTDPEMVCKALNRASRMINEIAGGTCAGPVIDEFLCPRKPRQIRLRSFRLLQLLGLSMESDFVEKMLSRLGFEVQSDKNESWMIGVPSFRADVELEEDLVEEIAREYGYDHLPTTYPAASTIGSFGKSERQKRLLSTSLESSGFHEAMNYAFTSPEKEELLLGCDRPSLVPIANPLTEEHTHLRSTLLVGLLESIRRNLNFGNKNVRLFETGKVFIQQNEDSKHSQEKPCLALVATGLAHGSFWDGEEDNFGFHYLKGVLDMILRKFGLQAEYRKASDLSYLHPGVSSKILLENVCLGVFGQLHPRIQEQYKFSQNILVAELQLERLYSQDIVDPTYVALDRFPSVEHDFSFLVDKSVDYARLLGAIRSLAIPELRNVRLIDLYSGLGVSEDKVSLTLRLTFADPERTLTLSEVKRQSEYIFSYLRTKLGVEGR